LDRQASRGLAYSKEEFHFLFSIGDKFIVELAVDLNLLAPQA
jgi:hypothetical protein